MEELAAKLFGLFEGGDFAAARALFAPGATVTQVGPGPLAPRTRPPTSSARAAPRRKWKWLYLDSIQPTGCASVYTSPIGASHIELPGLPPGWEWSCCVSELSSSE